MAELDSCIAAGLIWINFQWIYIVAAEMCNYLISGMSGLSIRTLG